LQFRRCWKASYAALSQSIRGLKASVKTTMRQREYAGDQQRELHARQVEATPQMHMLPAARLEASRQYAATAMANDETPAQARRADLFIEPTSRNALAP